MKEELEKIGIQLREWTRKYKKDYVSMCIIDGNINANISAEDKDYKEMEIFIEKEKENV